MFDIKYNVQRRPLDRIDLNNKIDEQLQAHSPYINGKKNEKFVPPHMRSQVNLGQKENSNARNQYTNKAKQQNEIEAELVCDNCLNSNLIKQKKQVTNDETNNRPITPDFSQHEKLKMMMKHRISSEIEKRQLLSEKAARAFINYSEKDKLIQAQEGKNFSLIDGNKDLVKEKALNNYKKREMVISKSSKYIHSEKPEVKEYYEKCVDNYDQKEVFKGYKNPCIGKVNYVAELDSQVLSKQVKEEKKKFIDKKNDEEMIEKNKKILEEERRQMVIKKKKMQEEFLLDNKNLISMKNLKEDKEKKVRLVQEKKQIDEAVKENEEIKKFNQEKDKLSKLKMQSSLSKQVKEKKAIEDKRKVEDKTNQNVSLKPSCTCVGLGKCSICFKDYPKKQMNNQALYRNILKGK